MFKWFKKEQIELKDKVLIRVCIGCVLPFNSKLRGTGSYTLMKTRGKVTEQYYDYEINEEDLNNFLDINSKLLIKYELLDAEIQEEQEDKNPVKPTTLRGWSKKD